MSTTAQLLSASCLRLRRGALSSEQFEEMLDTLVNHARGRCPAIIAGDFNAWAVEWGSRVSNPRGRAVIDAMMMLDLIFLNDGRVPTFNNDRGTSFIDVTFVSRGLVANSSWTVLNVVTLSDHAFITYTVSTIGTTRSQPRGSLRQAWDTRKFDEDMLSYQIDTLQIPTGDAETMAAELTKMLVATCDATMPRKKKGTAKAPHILVEPRPSAAAIGMPQG